MSSLRLPVARAHVNAYELTIPEASQSIIFHYDVVLTPWRDGINIGVSKGMELMMRLQTVVAPHRFERLGAFDGKKNLFSFKDFRIAQQSFNVPWDGSSGTTKLVSIRITHVRSLQLSYERLNGRLELIYLCYSTLKQLFSNQRKGGAVIPECLDVLNMLNLFVQGQPRMGNLHKGNSFFVPANHTSVNSSVPLQLWHGYFQSVRPTLDKIILNVDVTAGVILPGAPLEEVCARYLKVTNSRDMRNLSDYQLSRLRSFIRGIKVTVDLDSHRRRKSKTIKDIQPNVGDEDFERDGRYITVAEHFHEVHNISIRPGSLGVKVGKNELFPVTVCIVQQQLYRPRLSPEGTNEMLRFAPRNPQERFQRIEDGWRHLGYHTSEFLQGAGIRISPKPLQVLGKILPSPDITYGEGQIYKQVPGNLGKWKLENYKLATPAQVKNLLVINFACRTGPVVVDFVRDLCSVMQERGIKVTRTHGIRDANPQEDIGKVLQRHGKEVFADLIIVLLPENSAELYTQVKYYGDIVFGVSTQCVRWSEKIYRHYSKKSCNAYHNHLLLKINVRMGGCNHFPDDDTLKDISSFDPMIIGADVSHPSPNSPLPSVASMVASYDPFFSQYAARTRVQAARLEIIQDFGEMFDQLLEAFVKKRKRFPQYLIVYRDGVSEGEFDRVQSSEMSAMLDVVKKRYPKFIPKLLFIVVGKRHHFRFKPDDHHRDSSGNCPTGFVVDADLSHPNYYDFYLQSQPGQKGTSVPGHYTVLTNTLYVDGTTNGILQKIQQLSYALCHSYSRSTQSVKIPAPVYYADLVCRRAKFHYDTTVDLSDTMSDDSDRSQTTDYYREHFRPVNPKLQETMYFV